MAGNVSSLDKPRLSHSIFKAYSHSPGFCTSPTWHTAVAVACLKRMQVNWQGDIRGAKNLLFLTGACTP